MDQDFARLGEQLKAAREQRRPRISQAYVAAELGVGRSTIYKMESGDGARVTSTTLLAYARLLGWTDDSVSRVLAGGDPVIATSETEAAAQHAIPGVQLSPAVEYELRSGKVLDSQVFNLGPDDDDGQIIVVLQGKKDATPEEAERVAARYRRARRHLQGLASDLDGVAES
ncbi:helix-turn-helix domain-containing protein [Streptomyces sp. NBC_01571]|uniref:helix-turn-helix domain-containing protein n=1 Tax=Streptomyces sp. NBC_01571 TaxID=2975883 RepID=UPI00225A4341|nr:helix-turn-helix transcriptional regulator [Streptomyces sp. NBC_01571]MCX4575669.1 helix-turn-helix domain-containing protein [Streptomyces sp. NBC_01571]